MRYMGLQIMFIPVSKMSVIRNKFWKNIFPRYLPTSPIISKTVRYFKIIVTFKVLKIANRFQTMFTEVTRTSMNEDTMD